MMSTVVVSFVVVSITASSENGTGRTRSDLEGTWQAIDGEGNGQKMPVEQVKELRVVVRADQLAIKPDGEGRKTTFKLDASKAPNTIDLIPLDGPRKGDVVPGIYSVQSGQLMLCVNVWGKDSTLRPSEFKTHEGDGFVLVILQRARQ